MEGKDRKRGEERGRRRGEERWGGGVGFRQHAPPVPPPN